MKNRFGKAYHIIFNIPSSLTDNITEKSLPLFVTTEIIMLIQVVSTILVHPVYFQNQLESSVITFRCINKETVVPIFRIPEIQTINTE